MKKTAIAILIAVLVVATAPGVLSLLLAQLDSFLLAKS